MTMKDRVKELRRVPASELRANPKNWRRHPPSQEAALRGVLEDIGFADAVIARETDDGLELIDGHLRQEVMGDQSIPVLIVDVTEEEADKMLLTYDPLAMMAHADTDQLLGLLRDNPFESNAVADMLEALVNGERDVMPNLHEPPVDPGPEIDRADELREKWQTERGQIWEVGRHRLICGDATSAEDVAETLNGASPSLMVTDPPYGIALDTDYTQMPNDLIHSKKYDRVTGDDRPFDASKVALTLHSVQEQFWFGANYYRQTLSSDDADGSWLVWDKRIEANDALFGSSFELIWSRVGHHQRILRHMWVGYTAHDPRESRFHPTQKPISLIKEIVDNWGKEGPIIDPFLGSGTTMVAAEQLGRICYGMEIEPKYVAVTLERMSGMGLEPKLVTG